MITNKLRSPFLFGLLCIVWLFFGCNNSKELHPNKDKFETIDKQIEAANQTNLVSDIRLENASKAYDLAIELDSSIVVWRAFSTKYALLQQQFPHQAAAFLQTYTRNSKKQKDTLNLSTAFFQKGKQFEANDKPDSAYFYYNASRILSEARKDSMAVAEKLLNMANMHYGYSDFATFESTTTEALQFLKKIPETATDSIFRMIAYNNYGLAYTHLYEYQNAIRYYRLAFDFNSDKTYGNTILNNLALVYMQDKKYAKAISILSALPNLAVVKSDSLLQARILDNLGYSQWKTGEVDGIKNMLKAFDMRKRQNDLFGATASGIHLAKYYKTSAPQKSNNYALEAYQSATLLKSTGDRLSTLKILAAGNSPNSKKFADSYIFLKDSIDEVRQKAKNQFVKIKYDSKLTLDENGKLKNQQAESKLKIVQQKNTGLLIIIVALLVVGITIYIYYKEKVRRRQAVYETETRIARQLHDELANDMHHTMTLAEVSNLGSVLEKEPFMQQLDKLYQRIRSISKENQDIDTGSQFPLLLKEMIYNYQSAEVNVISSGIEDIPWPQLSRDKKIAVQRIVQEWLVNMKKHSQSNIAVLKFEKQGKKITISYQDNGVGNSKKEIILKGGLQNVETRIRAIKGTVIFDHESQNGFHSRITFPI